ncbi:TetR/AcrR family transcriptional regulator [Actinomyces faecalis]|uniref:TetR/AcrR family transcriptional regulator n=1 Tax=Actinomyces faecalis TaxID=2722820 RepID=UPI001555405A|nr:TetR/AcrR family transcriptional regulator [Actinomyces faecalis]
MAAKINGARKAAERLSARRAAVRRIAAADPSDKRAQTQALLLEAGRELFTDQGIGGTSVGDLCSRAGFTRGAFYSNFADMDHFVSQVAEREWEQMTDYVRKAVDQALPETVLQDSSTEEGVLHALEELAARILRAMPVSRQFYLLQSEIVAYVLRNEEHAAALRGGYETFRSSLQEIVVSGLAAIGRECLLSADDTTELLFAAAERSMRTALLAGNEDDLTALLERSLPELLIHMSRPLEG